MMDAFNNAQEWFVVLGYLGFTVFIVWCVLMVQKK